MKREDIKIGNKYRVIGMSGNRVDITTHHFEVGSVVTCVADSTCATYDVDCEDGTGLWQFVNPCDLEPV